MLLFLLILFVLSVNLMGSYFREHFFSKRSEECSFKKGTLTPSPCVAVVNPIHIGGYLGTSVFCKWLILKRRTGYSLLKWLFFYKTVCKQKKYLEKLDGKLTFKTCLRNRSQTGKNMSRSVDYNKVAAVVLIFHFRGMLIPIFRMHCNEV